MVQDVTRYMELRASIRKAIAAIPACPENCIFEAQCSAFQKVKCMDSDRRAAIKKVADLSGELIDEKLHLMG